MEQHTETKESTPVTPQQETPHGIDPLSDGISSLQLIRASGSDVDVVNAARVSYGSFVEELSDRDIKLIRFLAKHKHTSPFEHNQLSFRVKTPMFVARQWMRHRINSYNEISYRYVKAPLEFYVPKEWRAQHKTNHQASAEPFTDEALKREYIACIETCKKTYEHLLEKGVCKELARGLLPVCTYTEFIFTCNMHSLVHFIRLRTHSGAQYEIRKYAEGMLELALPSFPVSLGAWKAKWAKQSAA